MIERHFSSLGTILFLRVDHTFSSLLVTFISAEIGRLIVTLGWFHSLHHLPVVPSLITTKNPPQQSAEVRLSKQPVSLHSPFPEWLFSQKQQYPQTTEREKWGCLENLLKHAVQQLQGRQGQCSYLPPPPTHTKTEEIIIKSHTRAKTDPCNSLKSTLLCFRHCTRDKITRSPVLNICNAAHAIMHLQWPASSQPVVLWKESSLPPA